MATHEQSGPIQQRYRRYAAGRQPFLDEARKCAALTIPSLCPPDGLAKGDKLYEPWQSLGAHGVKNLSEKILMALFPPGRAFFRLSVNQYDLDRMVEEMAATIAREQGADGEAGGRFIENMRREVTADIEKALAASERAIIRDFEMDNNRPTDSEAVKHLINDGSVLRFCPQSPDEQPRIYDLAHHVVKRDPDGTVLEMITQDGLSPLSVSEDVREACGLETDPDKAIETEYDLYTQILRADNRWEVVQELNGVEIPDSRGTYPLDACPWVPLRWTKIDGEDYGRGHVSDYRGSLRALESLTRALVENAAAGARTLCFVNPNSQYGTRLRDVARAENGAVLPGRSEDVTFLQVGKHNDLSVAFQQLQVINTSLSQAFLLNSSVRRDAERVTAREITALTQELELALGGVYSTLGKEYQAPVLRNLMAKMESSGSLQMLPSEVSPTIITGVDALGRNADLDRIAQFGQFLGMFPQQIVMEYLRFADIFKQGAVASGIDVDSLLLTEEEVEESRLRRQQMALAERAIGPAIAAGSQENPRQSTE